MNDRDDARLDEARLAEEDAAIGRALGRDNMIAEMYVDRMRAARGNTRQELSDADAMVAAELRQRRAQLVFERKITVAQEFGYDDWDEHTVVRWTKVVSFRTGVKSAPLTFVALKAGGKWYVTGARVARKDGLQWDELVELWVSGEHVVTVDDVELLNGETTMAVFRRRARIEAHKAEHREWTEKIGEAKVTHPRADE